MENFAFFTTVYLVYYLTWRFIVMPNARMTYRDRMFELRSNLFEFMKSNNKSYDQPLYRNTRELLNSYIRFANKVSFFSMLTGAILYKKGKIPSVVKELESDISSCEDEDLVKYIKSVIEKTARITIKYLLFTNIFTMALFLIFVFCIVPILIVIGIVTNSGKKLLAYFIKLFAYFKTSVSKIMMAESDLDDYNNKAAVH